MSTEEEVTVYIAVLNESETIQQLLDSLVDQTRPPDEILIVDGGSTDGTVEIVQRFSERYRSIRLILAPGTNIAEARNLAFENALHNLIASIDGGCTARPDWLSNLMAAMKVDVDMVVGVYVADSETTWDRVIEHFYYPNLSAIPDDWDNPWCSSILIRRKVWKQIGPIPANLYRSEDKWFNLEVRKQGFHSVVARNAVVHWKTRSTLWEVFWNAFVWIKSDLENQVNLSFERKRAVRISLRLTGKILAVALWMGSLIVSPIAGLMTLPLLAVSLVKFSHSMRGLRHIALFNIVDYTIMFASASGLVAGEMARLRNGRRPAGGRITTS